MNRQIIEFLEDCLSLFIYYHIIFVVTYEHYWHFISIKKILILINHWAHDYFCYFLSYMSFIIFPWWSVPFLMISLILFSLRYSFINLTYEQSLIGLLGTSNFFGRPLYFVSLETSFTSYICGNDDTSVLGDYTLGSTI